MMCSEKIKWSTELAYAIGLIVTDGCLYSDGRHINLTSKDKEQIENFSKCLNLNNKISNKYNGSKKQSCFVIQFGNVYFYRFLNKIGIHPAKSKTISTVLIPRKYFLHFLRGHFDGDGSFYSYFDPRWKSSFMFYTTFVSASNKHIDWIRGEIERSCHIKGHITKAEKANVYQLKYAKADSLKVLRKMYGGANIYLHRKKLKIDRALSIIGLSL